MIWCICCIFWYIVNALRDFEDEQRKKTSYVVTHLWKNYCYTWFDNSWTYRTYERRQSCSRCLSCSSFDSRSSCLFHWQTSNSIFYEFIFLFLFPTFRSKSTIVTKLCYTLFKFEKVWWEKSRCSQNTHIERETERSVVNVLIWTNVCSVCVE